MALSKNNRLRRKRDFDAVFKEGRTAGGNFLFIKFRRSPSDQPRFSFVVSARVVKRAVVRNMMRRHLSEAVRSRLPVQAGQAYDVAVIITKLPPEGLPALRDDLLAVLRKASIL